MDFLSFTFFTTLPGLVMALLGVAFVDRVVLRRGKAAATGFGMPHANFADGGRHELESRGTELFPREKKGDGVARRTRVDLDGGVVRIRSRAVRGDAV